MQQTHWLARTMIDRHSCFQKSGPISRISIPKCPAIDVWLKPLIWATSNFLFHMHYDYNIYLLSYLCKTKSNKIILNLSGDMMHQRSFSHSNIKFQWVILLVGVLLFCIKFLAFFITNSVGILSDALESIVNIITGMITLPLA